MRIYILILFCFSQIVCGQENLNSALTVTSLISENISIRAIAIDGESVWYAADKGRYGSVNIETKAHFQSLISTDSVQPEYRSIAVTSNYVFVANAGTPTFFYKISKSKKNPSLVYRNDNEKSFCDAMAFYNDQIGLAIGDQIVDCLTIWKTTDAGESWQIVPCSIIPKAIKGEAAFAASNSILKIIKNEAWIFSGGVASRVYHSSDLGSSWTVVNTPIVQGSTMTGIFGGDFYDEKNGFAVGGNYEKPSNNAANKIVSDDGGKTWNLTSAHSGFGYASCIQYFPKSHGSKLVSVGQSGVFVSSDTGRNWKKISDNKNYYTIRFLGKNKAIAAGKNVLDLLEFR